MNKKGTVILTAFFIFFGVLQAQTVDEFNHGVDVSYTAYRSISDISNYSITAQFGDYVLKNLGSPLILAGVSSFSGSGNGIFNPNFILKNIGGRNFKLDAEISVHSILNSNFKPEPLPADFPDFTMYSETGWNYSLKAMVTLFKKIQLGIKYERVDFLSYITNEETRIYDPETELYYSNPYEMVLRQNNVYQEYYLNLLDIDFGKFLGRHTGINVKSKLDRIQLFNSVRVQGDRMDSVNTFFVTGLKNLPFINLNYMNGFDVWTVDVHFRMRSRAGNLWIKPSFTSLPDYWKSLEVVYDIFPLVSNLFPGADGNMWNQIADKTFEQLFNDEMESQYESGMFVMAGPGFKYTRQSPYFIQQDVTYGDEVSVYWSLSPMVRTPHMFFVCEGTFGWNDPVSGFRLLNYDSMGKGIFNSDHFFSRITYNLGFTF